MRDSRFWQSIRELDEAHRNSKDSISLVDLIPNEFYNKNLDEYEKREDGKIVRKDRWETAIRSIQIFLRDVGILKMSNNEFEIADVVSLVERNIIRWQAFTQDNIEFETGTRYLVTVINKTCEDESLEVMEAYLKGGCFYFTENINEKLEDNFLEVTHFAPLPQPAKQDNNHD